MTRILRPRVTESVREPRVHKPASGVGNLAQLCRASVTRSDLPVAGVSRSQSELTCFGCEASAQRLRGFLDLGSDAIGFEVDDLDLQSHVCDA